MRFVLWYDTIREVRNHPAPPHPTPPRPAPPHPVPAPHPPGFQPGVAHGTQLNASVARGDTKTNEDTNGLTTILLIRMNGWMGELMNECGVVNLTLNKVHGLMKSRMNECLNSPP